MKKYRLLALLFSFSLVLGVFSLSGMARVQAQENSLEDVYYGTIVGASSIRENVMFKNIQSRPTLYVETLVDGVVTTHHLSVTTKGWAWLNLEQYDDKEVKIRIYGDSRSESNWKGPDSDGWYSWVNPYRVDIYLSSTIVLGQSIPVTFTVSNTSTLGTNGMYISSTADYPIENPEVVVDGCAQPYEEASEPNSLLYSVNSGICGYDVIAVTYAFTPAAVGTSQVIVCADQIFCKAAEVEVLDEVSIPPVPVGISFTNPPLERGNWEGISFFSGQGADSLLFSSTLPITDIPQGCTPNQVPVYSMSCDPGDYSFELFIQENELATTVTFFVRSWYGSQDRHTSITAGITDPPIADSVNFSTQGGYVVEPGNVVTLTSVITAGQSYSRLPFTTTVGEVSSGLDIYNYALDFPNGGGCSLTLDYSTLTCGAVQVEAGQVITLAVYAQVLDVEDGRLQGEMAAGSESQFFDFVYNKFAVQLEGVVVVGQAVQVTVEMPNTGYYDMHLKGLKALELPTGCLPDPGANEPGHFLCETLGFGSSLVFQAEVIETGGWVKITSPYGWAYKEFGVFCTQVGGQGSSHYVRGFVWNGLLAVSEAVKVQAWNSSGEELGCAVTSPQGEITWLALRDGPEGEVITFSVAGEVAFTCGEVIRPAIPTLAEDTSEIAVRLNIQSSHRCFVMLPSVQR